MAMAIACIGLLAWPAALPRLGWERAAIAEYEIWRVVSAHLVHLSGWQALANLTGLALVIEWLGPAGRPAEALFILLVSALAVSAGLAAFTDIAWYAGLSGVVHGLWAGLALLGWQRQSLRQRRSRPQPQPGHLPLYALLALLIKLALPVAVTADLPVVPQSHAYGAIGGLVAAMALLAGLAAAGALLVTYARRTGRAGAALARRCFRLE